MSVASKNQTAFPLLLVSFYFLPSAPFATVIFGLAFIQIYAIKGGNSVKSPVFRLYHPFSSKSNQGFI